MIKMKSAAPTPASMPNLEELSQLGLPLGQGGVHSERSVGEGVGYLIVRHRKSSHCPSGMRW